MTELEVFIDGEVLRFSIEGDPSFGADEILVEQDDDLTAGTAWHQSGYTVEPFLTASQYAALRSRVVEILKAVMSRHVARDLSDFALERYHEFVTDEEHLQLVTETREGIAFDQLPFAPAIIEERISEICGVSLSKIYPIRPTSEFFVRIIRPLRGDYNPPHRDAWVNQLRHGINIFAPLSESNEKSSLPVLPGSHLWKESDVARSSPGGTVNGVTYRVPVVAKSRRRLEMVRPNPKPNEVMVFSPYLIHGAGANLNPETTRMSLEMRFFRQGLDVSRYY